MAWVSEPPGGRRSTSPTVFEQQREELIREIAVVSAGLSPGLFNLCIACVWF